MKLGKNLYKENGKWIVYFSGNELKVARRNGRINVLKYEFEDDGTGFVQLLDEYVETWREGLISVHRGYISTPRGKSIIETAKRHADLHDKTGRTRPPDCDQADHKYVFVNSHGLPLTANDVYMRFRSTTYKYLGVPVNPHMVRHIWTTEYMTVTRENNGYADVDGAAAMLGDTPQAVRKHYAHLATPDLQKMPKAWLISRLAKNTAKTSPKNPKDS